MSRESVRRKPLANFGRKGKAGQRGAGVAAFVETLGGRIVDDEKGRKRVEGATHRLVRVQWTERGERLTRSWPDTVEGREEARGFADGVLDRLAAIRRGENPDAPTDVHVPLTLRELWDRYLTAHDHLRPRSRENYRERWEHFELHMGAHSMADAATREDLDDLRKALKPKHEINQVAAILSQIRTVYRFGVDRDLVRERAATKLATYTWKIGKDEKRLKVAEYTRDEAQRLLAGAEPLARDPHGWRFYVALYVFAHAGPRHNAAEHLTWPDVDFEAGTLTWRSQYDKLGKEDRVQPVPAVVLDALRVALGWREAVGYDGPWVLFRPGMGTIDRGGKAGGGKWRSARQARRREGKVDQPWTYSAAIGALRRAERAATPVIPHLKYRGFHGLRRFVVNEILEQTGGNLILAGQYVGDDDLRTLTRSYVRPRAESLRGVADLMAGASATGGRPDPARPTASRNAVATPGATPPDTPTAPREGGAVEPTQHQSLTEDPQ